MKKGKCCKFVVEAKIWVEDRQFSSSLRTRLRMKRCSRLTFEPAAIPYAWPLWSAKREFLAQLTEPQVFVNAS
jgi:hypothetical protein